MKNIVIQVLASIVATYGFGIVFNVRGQKIIYASLCGGLGWLVYSILNYNGFTDLVAYTAASSSITIYSELLSKKLRIPTIALLFPSMIPLVPGGGIYFTMYNLVQDNISGAIEKCLETFIISGSIAIGILIVSTFSQIYYYLIREKEIDDRYI
ncbi:threonine/serine exporter family protein [Cetobacterium sp. SF1]|uniref:threonine/serine exporter family protein n=1 Tax=Cetobacterium sp. SF1 TaxID=3417654 RepID=UPI003CE75757